MRTAFALLLVVVTCIVLTSPAPAQAAVANFWQRHVTGTLSSFPSAAAIDASGNVFVTGSFSGQANFGGGTLTSAGNADVFIAKYSPGGTCMWSARYGGTAFDDGRSISVDGNGNVYATGSYTNTVSLGGASLTAFGVSNIWVAKYTTNGAHVWSKGFGTTMFENGTGIAATPAGFVYITGSFQSTINFGGSNLVPQGATDIYLCRLDTNGNHFWSQRFGGNSSDYNPAVATNSASEVYLTGTFNGPAVSFGGSAFNSGGWQQGFIAKYNLAGTHQWSREFGGVTDDYGTAMAVDTNGDLIVTGYFEGTANFGGSNLASLGDSDAFLAKYTSAGTHIWSARYGGADIDIAHAVALDGSGHIVLTGEFIGSADYGSGTLVSDGAAEDAFLARYDSDGTPLWSASFGDTDYDAGWALAADGAGNITLGASFIGTVDFGAGNLTTPSAISNMVLVRYGNFPRDPVINSIVDVPNDQGRRVKIAFTRSGHDALNAPGAITSYEIFRRNDTPPSNAIATAAMTVKELLIAGWQFVAALPAHLDDANLVSAPTLGDSTVAFGQFNSVFFVRAATYDPAVFYDSPIDSGYSIDNLPPPPPQNVDYDAGELSWDASAAEDFNFFTIYGSSSAALAGRLDGSLVRLGTTTGVTFDVSSLPHDFYYVTASDFSGNEGIATEINSLTGTDDTPRVMRTLAVNAYPNPFNPRTTIRYDVPGAGAVRLTIYDATGARVATLLDAAMPAGEHSLTWEGRNDRGEPVGSGVYFVEVRFGADMKTRKLTLVK